MFNEFENFSHESSLSSQKEGAKNTFWEEHPTVWEQIQGEAATELAEKLMNRTKMPVEQDEVKNYKAKAMAMITQAVEHNAKDLSVETMSWGRDISIAPDAGVAITAKAHKLVEFVTSYSDRKKSDLKQAA